MGSNKLLTQSVAAGSDHAGYDYKVQLLKFLEKEGFKLNDKGTNSSQSVDYPDFAHPVSESVESCESDWGLLICGSANGVAITANKHQNIRAAICWKTEIAALARQHNNANIICIPARFVSIEEAIEMVKVFIATPFEGGRHAGRVQKISCS